MLTDETRFLAYARGGDPAVLEELLRANAESAYQQAVRLLGNPADAEDAVQEAFLQTVRTAARYRPTIPFRAWLGQLVHHAALRVQRSRTRRERRHQRAALVTQAAQAQAAPGAAPPGSDHGDVGDLAEAVRRAVATLPASCRAAIDLHYFAGLSQLDTARALGVSANAVAVRIHRGRERLRRALEHRHPLPLETVVAALTAAPAPSAPATIAAIASHAGEIARAAAPAASAPGGRALLWPWRRHAFASAGSALLAAGVVVATLVSLTIVRGHALHPAAAPAALAARPGVVTAATAAPAVVWWSGPAGQLLPWIDPQAMLAVGIDWAALRRQGALAPPTSLLADPRLAGTLQHLRQELALWSENSRLMPPLASWWDQAQGLVQSVRLDGDHDHAEMHALLVADLGAGSSTWERYLTRQMQVPLPPGSPPGGLAAAGGYAPLQVGPFVGQVRAGTVVAYAGSRLALGSQQLLGQLAATPTAVVPAWRTAPLWLQFDATRLFAVLPAQLPGFDQLVPGWHGAQPHLGITVTPTPAGWTGTTTLSGLPRPRLGTLGPAASGVVASSGLGGVAIALPSSQELLAIAQALFPGWGLSAAGSPGRESPLAGILAAGTGELAVSIDPGSPLPSISLVLPLRDDAPRAALGAALAAVMIHAGGTPLASPWPGTTCWACPTPLGPGRCLLGADRLVWSTATTLPPRLVQARGAGLGCAILARGDLAQIARTYLPLLRAHLPPTPYYLPNQTVIDTLAWLSDDAIGFIQDTSHGRVGTSFGVYATTPQSGRGSSSAALTLLGDHNAAQTLEDGLAIFTNATRSSDWYAAEHVVLYRQADGWHELPLSRYLVTGPGAYHVSTPSYQEWMTPAMTLERARSRTSGLRQLAGPALGALRLLPLPHLASFDPGWLPDTEICCEHLRSWRLTATVLPDGLRIDEQGAPLVAAVALLVPPWLLMTHRRSPVASHPAPAEPTAPAAPVHPPLPPRGF